MSEITGKGYGSDHAWVNKGTEQMPHKYDRSTLWVCKDCRESFRHHYNVTEDIFQEMKNNNITEKCEGKK